MSKYAKVRVWLHGVAIAALPVLVALGYITDEQVTLWAGLIAAILVPGIGLVDAAKHDGKIDAAKDDAVTTTLEEIRVEDERNGRHGKHTG